MRPVARWQFSMALTLSVPCADWLTPCEYIVTVRSVSRNILKKATTSASGSPVANAVAAVLAAMPRARAVVGEMHKQTGEQRGGCAGLQSQEQFGVLGGIGAAGIDHDHARSPRL